MEITERDETLGISRQIVTFLHIYIYINDGIEKC